MKTITCNRYSYNFYKAEGQPIVEWCIEGELKQVVRVTAEAGNQFFVRLSKLDHRYCMRKVIDATADHAFREMFIACERLNSRRGQCKIAQDVPSVDTISNVCPEMEPDLFRVMKVAGSVRQAYLSDLTQDEAYRWCEENGWELRDHNGFVWGLEVAVQY